MVIFPKIDFGLCYPHLFQVFLRPSFGACAPPSPNLTFITYNFLRRVGRLQTFSLQMSRKNKYFPPSGKTSFLIFEFYVFFAEGLFNFVHILFKLRFLLRRIDGFQNFDVVIAHRFNYF